MDHLCHHAMSQRLHAMECVATGSQPTLSMAIRIRMTGMRSFASAAVPGSSNHS